VLKAPISAVVWLLSTTAEDHTWELGSGGRRRCFFSADETDIAT